MAFSIATWNINSVRLRFPQVARFCDETHVDVLCLQETKCPDDKFPLAAFHDLGFRHAAILGQKGYNGVAILSRHPFATTAAHPFCARSDARHIAVTMAPEAGAAAGLTVHNLYIPAGGDIPDVDVNPRFAHKLAFLDEFLAWSEAERRLGGPRVVVGDLNVAPLEHDVWSHKRLLDVVSHTPAETERLTNAYGEGRWVDAVRDHRPSPEKVYSWWSYRAADWAAADKGRRLDHVWLSESLAPALAASDIRRATRGWERPSDHVPVIATLDL